MKTRWIIFFLWCWSPQLCGQSMGLEIPGGKGHVNIPFEYENNFIIVKVTFNFIFQLNFIFDTGAEHTIITNRSVTDKMNIPYSRTFKVRGADAQEDLTAYLVQDLHFKVGNVNAPSQDALVLEEDYFRFDAYTGIEIHGIMGADMFSKYVLKINYQQKVISLYRPEVFAKMKLNDYQQLDLEVKKNKPYLQTQLSLSNDKNIDTKLLIDTGASLALLINTFSHPDLELPSEVIPGNIGMGLGGFLEGYKGRVKQLKLGTSDLYNIITNFQDLPIQEDTTYLNGRNGIIGNEILNRFTIFINYGKEQLYFKPNKDIDRAFKFDRSGLLLIAAGERLNAFTVWNVITNSPAHRAGLRQGDIVKSINYLPCNLFSLEDISNIFQGKVGKKKRLVIRRFGQRVVVKFQLEEIL